MTALTGYNRFLACKHILSEKLDWNAKNSRSMQQAPQVQTRRKMKTKKNKKRHTIFSAQLWTMIYNKKRVLTLLRNIYIYIITESTWHVTTTTSQHRNLHYRSHFSWNIGATYLELTFVRNTVSFFFSITKHMLVKIRRLY